MVEVYSTLLYRVSAAKIVTLQNTLHYFLGGPGLSPVIYRTGTTLSPINYLDRRGSFINCYISTDAMPDAVR